MIAEAAAPATAPPAPVVTATAPTAATATRAFLGMGSNLGDRRSYLRQAVVWLESLPQIEVVAVSPVYETEPIGGPDQGAYLNLVVELATTLAPRELLLRCLEAEQLAGRLRRERWGPRTLDVDVLWIENVTLNEPDLSIPHQRMWQRRFVMLPLADLAPEFLANWVDPDDGAITNAGALFEQSWEQVKSGVEPALLEPSPPDGLARPTELTSPPATNSG